ASGIARRRRRRPWRPRSRSPATSRAPTPSSWRGRLDRFGGLDCKHDLEAVDLVVPHPDLREAEYADDRQRGCVAWRGAGIDLWLSLLECPAHERAGGFLGGGMPRETARTPCSQSRR